MTKLIIAFIAVATLLISNEAAASCTSVSGTGQATDSACTTSPLGLCTNGTLTGTLAGTYSAAFESITPAPTLTEPLRLAFTVNDTITTSSGTLNDTETGYLVLNDTLGAATCIVGCATSSTPDTCLAGCVATYGRTTFVQDLTPVSGTGAYSSITSGLIVATGYGDYTSGVSYIDYSGQICN